MFNSRFLSMTMINFNFFRHSLKLNINTDLLGLCGHVAMRVLAEGKISGIGNWQICSPYRMTLSNTPLALAIFVLYIS